MPESPNTEILTETKILQNTTLDVDLIRKDFPILHRTIHGNPLAFLDNAASTQKPQVVIDTLSEFYQSQNANIHRGVYYLSQIATNAYEKSRQKVQHFINARSPN